jgi:hypothetical protein
MIGSAMGPDPTVMVTTSLAVPVAAARQGECDVRVGAYSLVASDAQCGPRCPEHVAFLPANFRRYAALRPMRDCDVSDMDLAIDRWQGSVTRYHRPLAMLQLPASAEGYDRAIGSKSVNMVRKARRAGYRAGALQADAHLDDIFTIRNSAPQRRGHAIPDYWKEPAKRPISNAGLCRRHAEALYGVLRDDRLVGYCSLRIFGQVAQVNQILGHADHLHDGIMNLLVRQMVASLLADYPLVRAVNYLYPSDDSLGRFKRNLGFHPCWTLTTVAPPSIAQAIDQAMRVGQSARADRPPSSQVRREPYPVLEEGLLWQGCSFLPGTSAERARLFGESLPVPRHPHVLYAGLQPTVWPALLNALDPCFVRAAPVLQGNAELGPYDLILLEANSHGVGTTLGDDLAAAADLLAPRGCLVVRLLWRPRRAQAAGVLNPTRAATLQAAYQRRFRSAEPGHEEFQRGFRGSAFQYRGLLDDANSESESTGTGWLVLRKVR